MTSADTPPTGGIRLCRRRRLAIVPPCYASAIGVPVTRRSTTNAVPRTSPSPAPAGTTPALRCLCAVVGRTGVSITVPRAPALPGPLTAAATSFFTASCAPFGVVEMSSGTGRDSPWAVPHTLWLLLGGRHVELFQVRDQVLTGVSRAHLPVDVEDLAVRSDVERPAIGHFADVELAVIGQHTVLPRGFLRRVGEDREVGLLLLRERGVVRQGVDADHEIRDVERANQLAALTERLAFGGSTTGERLGEPCQHDGFAAQLG